MTPPPSRPFATGLAAIAMTGVLLLGSPSAFAQDIAPTTSAQDSSAQPTAASSNVLVGGEELKRGQSIQSATATFRMQDDGNAVVYSSGAVRGGWNTGTQGRGDRLVVQTDGNVVVYDAANRPVWSTGTDGEPGSVLRIQDDGNLVVYRASGSPAWASSVNSRITAPDVVVLEPGQSLTAGQQLTADASRATMQSDGNFVIYTSGQPQWSTETTGAGNRLEMQRDGNAVIYGADGSVKWSSGTAGNPGAQMTLTPRGVLVIGGSQTEPLWSSSGQLRRDTLQQEDSLVAGEQLTSASGAWRAEMQYDGNFVVYGARGADWFTGTSVPDSVIALDLFGDLVVYAPGSGEGEGIWGNGPKTTFSSGPNGQVQPFRLVMQDDGNLVEYDGLGRPVWASRGV
ncbi:hypothetical protein [Rathayibacter tanaceti]|uniref:D-mannose binding lectin n=2 Tax=Rathayibacter tanaceti TaxID=1671680 RepID=A0A166HVU1_9MICO|nr:hypothetical protein [Rathayibacter tanaceti]KZX21235.1 D-mannose binding lectin [Rathayibacter tanaceti]QHC56822.1 hypothetical protein GSU10_15080 [Rathayibacter tanaceti]TCO37835.1 D-mannose binding lectin [Rathayibacter tanaceti]